MPADLWNFYKWGSKAVNMFRLIAHFTEDKLILLRLALAYLACFTLRTFPGELFCFNARGLFNEGSINRCI